TLADPRIPAGIAADEVVVQVDRLGRRAPATYLHVSEGAGAGRAARLLQHVHHGRQRTDRVGAGPSDVAAHVQLHRAPPAERDTRVRERLRAARDVAVDAL